MSSLVSWMLMLPASSIILLSIDLKEFRKSEARPPPRPPPER